MWVSGHATPRPIYSLEREPATQTNIAVKKYTRVVHLTAGRRQLFTFQCSAGAGDCIFLYGKRNENHQLGRRYFVQHRIVSPVKREEFIGNRMSYIILRVRWCNIILYVHAPSEEKSDDSKDSFCEELEQVFNHFPKHHTKILLVDFNAKLGAEGIFKPTTGNDSLHQDGNDNGIRMVNLVTLKI